MDQKQDYKEIKENAKQCFLAKKFQEALPLYKKSFEALSQSKTVSSKEKQEQLCIIKSNIGYVYMKLKKFKEAIPHLNEAAKINPVYEKSYFRLAQCHFELKDHKSAAINIQKLNSSSKDKAVINLRNKLMKHVIVNNSYGASLNKFKECFSDENIADLEVREKVMTETGEKVEVYEKQELKNPQDIEYSLVSLHKVVETESKMKILLKILYEVFGVVKRRSLAKWKSLNMESNYYKMIALLYSILEKISEKSVASYYKESNEYFNDFKVFYKYIWDSYLLGEDKLKDVILCIPLSFREIEILNSISLRLKVNEYKFKEKETGKCKKIQLFFNVLSSKFRRLADVDDSYFSKIETRTIKEEKEVIIEFLERVSRSNSKEAKRFLVAFLKSISEVFNGNFSKIMMEEMSHLYKDNFSFQSILLMNSLILSDFPKTVDELSKTQPIFIVKFFL